MLKLIKSDFYKLFRMKSFYICGVIAAVLAGLGIFSLNAIDKMQYAVYGLEDMFISQKEILYNQIYPLMDIYQKYLYHDKQS